LPFREAGLDIANFKSVPSTSVPLHAYDARAAWAGPDPAHPELITHVEAAAFRGKLVYFETVYPWDQPLRQEQPPESGGTKALTFILIAIYLVALFGSLMLARRNLRLGRGDRRGATRVALFYFTVEMLVWLFIQHHNGLPRREFDLFFLHLATALLSSTFLWLLYVALEPFIRRRWPAWIISWSRLLAGDFRDPLVGRDILLGAAIGALYMLVIVLIHFSPSFLGQAPALMLNPGSEMLGNHFFLRFTGQAATSLFQAFISVFLLLLFVVILRRERLAVLALWLLFTLVLSLLTEGTWITVPFTALAAAIVVFTLIRFGLLAVISTLFFCSLVIFYPITTEPTAWYATDFTIALALALVLAAYGFYVSLGGQKLLSGKLLEE
jgi:serine/threonine-protein kinase